jgi:hypothetical protein
MNRILADGHVHVHPGWDRCRALDAAADNFARAAARIGGGAPAAGVLCLAESSGVHAFEELAAGASIGPWRAAVSMEKESLVIRKAGAAVPLALLAGRQIATAEKLEVLALATSARLPDGLSLRETISAAWESGGIPVIPWGFGKWTGGRGARVRALIAAGPNGVSLGDNGGRARGLPRPKLLAEGERNGFRVLPGSDPLPLPGQVDRVGGFGWSMVCHWDEHRPAMALKAAVGDPAVSALPYGDLEDPLFFLARQLRMRLRKCRRPR